jgi:hypothetical protein
MILMMNRGRHAVGHVLWQPNQKKQHCHHTTAVLQFYFQKATNKLHRLAASFNAQHAANANHKPVAIQIRA